MNKGVLYDFEGFRIDTEQKSLMRGDDFVPLTPKAYETLLVLVRHRGKLISKDSLLDEVWKDTFVEESTLAQNISTLRKALSKYESGKDFIVTVPRRGYRFVAAVTETVADEEVLVVEKRSVTHIVAEQEQINNARTSLLSSWKWLTAGLGLLAAGAFAFFYFNSPYSQFETRFKQLSTTTLFSGENISSAVVSPDGKYIAVLEGRKDGDTILLKQISEGNPVTLVEESGLSVAGMVFAPEGDGIYYSAYRRSDPFPKYGNLYKVPLLGGASRLIAKDVDGPVAFSPDRKQMAFVRGKPETLESFVIIANTDGSNPKEITKRHLRDSFETSGISWSPKGDKIAVAAQDRNDRARPMKLLTVDVSSGEQTVLKGENWQWIGRAEWLSDGSGIVIAAYSAESSNLTDEVWFVSYPEGKARSVTRGMNGITGVGITQDAKTMIAGKVNRLTTRSYLNIDNPEDSTVIAKSVNESTMFALGAGWIGENRLVYAKTQNNNADIWSMNVDGSDNKQLTSESAADFDPVVSADGKYVYFRSNRSGKMTMWRMDSGGSDQLQIVEALYVSKPSLPSGGSRMFYSSVPEKTRYPVIMTADLHGKNAKKLTDFRSFDPKISPDGKLILCFAAKDGEPSDDPRIPLMLSLIDAASGKIIKQFEQLASREKPLLEWKHDNSGFYFASKSEEESVLQERGLDGAIVRTLRRWEDGKVFQMSLSADGKRLFFEKGEDVVSVMKLSDSTGE